MEFREINIADFKIFRNLINQLTIVNDFSKDDFKNYLNQTKYKKTFMVIVDKKVIGTGSVIIEKKISRDFKCVGHIEDIVIDFNYKGKGYGRKLINFLKNYCIKNNCYKIILNCNIENKSFYEKNGFSQKNLEMSFYIDEPKINNYE